ncbi:hypothetical protein CGCTS75_v007853 [Colletotrichum tropicale]|nr:hypothetical protein CGCTS75_v007853 [Colletotrichum tropicale]
MSTDTGELTTSPEIVPRRLEHGDNSQDDKNCESANDVPGRLELAGKSQDDNNCESTDETMEPFHWAALLLIVVEKCLADLEASNRLYGLFAELVGSNDRLRKLLDETIAKTSWYICLEVLQPTYAYPSVWTQHLHTVCTKRLPSTVRRQA